MHTSYRLLLIRPLYTKGFAKCVLALLCFISMPYSFSNPHTTPSTLPPCKGFGVTKSNQQIIVFHEKKTWTGLFNYLCLNHLCYPGENIQGFYRRTFAISPYPLKQILNLKFMVQDNLLGQYIAEKHVTTPLSACFLPE